VGLDPLRKLWLTNSKTSRVDGLPGSWNVTPNILVSGNPPEGAPWNACDVREKEPNDTRDMAIPYVIGETVPACVSTRLDSDYYEVTTPPGDAAGGYFLGGLTEVGNGALDLAVEVAGGVNREFIKSLPSAAAGMPIYFYWVAEPGTKYRVVARAKLGNPEGLDPFKYTLNLTYTKLDDPAEPNDTSAQAKPITVGTPFKGHFSTTNTEDHLLRPGASIEHEYFNVALAAGPVTIKVDDYPGGSVEGMTLYGPNNALYTFPQKQKVPVAATSNVASAGMYQLVLTVGAPTAGTLPSLDALPANLKMPYSLVVTQP
jgi:hypothetical protein